MIHNALHLAKEGLWNNLLICINNSSETLSERDEFGMLPLHWACVLKDTPSTIIHALINAYPEGAFIKTNTQMLPLHLAIRSKMCAENLRILCTANPGSIVTLNGTNDDMLPIEMAKKYNLSRMSMDVLENAYYLYNSFDFDFNYNENNMGHETSFPELFKNDSISSKSDMNYRNSYPFSRHSSMINQRESIEGFFKLDNTENKGFLPKKHIRLDVHNAILNKNNDIVTSPRPLQINPNQIYSPTYSSPNLNKPRNSILSNANSISVISTEFKISKKNNNEKENNNINNNCGFCNSYLKGFSKKHRCYECNMVVCKQHFAGKTQIKNSWKKRNVCVQCLTNIKLNELKDGKIDLNGKLSNSFSSPASGYGSFVDSIEENIIEVETDISKLEEPIAIKVVSNRNKPSYQDKSESIGSFSTISTESSSSSIQPINYDSEELINKHLKDSLNEQSGNNKRNDESNEEVNLLKKQIEKLNNDKMIAENQLKEQEKLHAETILLLTQTMARCTKLEFLLSSSNNLNMQMKNGILKQEDNNNYIKPIQNNITDISNPLENEDHFYMGLNFIPEKSI